MRHESRYSASRAGPSSPAARSGWSGEGTIHWRLLLIGVSAAGSLVALGCALTGHAMLGAQIFAAVVIVLVGLVLT